MSHATTKPSTVVVVGAGTFGTSTALWYAKCNYNVILLEQFDILDVRISSTDFNRIIRSDYRGDILMQNLAEKASKKWKEWKLLHRDGQLILSQQQKLEKGYVCDQFELLHQQNRNIQLLSFKQIGQQLPAWNIDTNNGHHHRWKQGFISTDSGWVHATKGLKYIINQCQQNNVDIRPNTTINNIKLIKTDGNIKAMLDTNNGIIITDLVIFCCGVWLQKCLKKLNLPSNQYMKPASNLCGYFKVKNDKNKWLFQSKRFPNFLADIEMTGYYGFPLNEGLIKIAQHELFNADPNGKYMNITNKFEIIGKDKECDSSLQRCMDHMLQFVNNELPFGELLELDYFDLCYYNKTDDHDFLIDYIPGYQNCIAVAGAGSGHSFKFLPIMGQIVMQCLTNSNAFNGRFKWSKPRKVVHFFGVSATGNQQRNYQMLQSKL